MDIYRHISEAAAAEAGLRHRLRREVLGVETTPQLAAALDVLIGIEPRRTEPAFAELAACDDLIFARARTCKDFEFFLGHRDVLEARLRDLGNYLELGKAERDFLSLRLAAIPELRRAPAAKAS